MPAFVPQNTAFVKLMPFASLKYSTLCYEKPNNMNKRIFLSKVLLLLFCITGAMAVAQDDELKASIVFSDQPFTGDGSGNRIMTDFKAGSDIYARIKFEKPLNDVMKGYFSGAKLKVNNSEGAAKMTFKVKYEKTGETVFGAAEKILSPEDLNAAYVDFDIAPSLNKSRDAYRTGFSGAIANSSVPYVEEGEKGKITILGFFLDDNGSEVENQNISGSLTIDYSDPKLDLNAWSEQIEKAGREDQVAENKKKLGKKPNIEFADLPFSNPAHKTATKFKAGSPVYGRNRLIIIIISIVVVAGLLGWLAVFLSRNIRERKEAYLKLQQKNTEIQVQGELLREQARLISKYQSQMNPHFIFNALNSIQGFVINDKKEKTIEQLQLFTSLMRQTLRNSDHEEITLDAEADYLKTYIRFEQSRFTEPLLFEVTIPENSGEILIPSMMVQPFIENAIKHAGLQAISNPSISVEMKVDGDFLKVTIKDNGAGFDATKPGIFEPTHAVSIAKTRLAIIFKANGKEFSDEHFKIISAPGSAAGTEVSFFLPLKYKY